MAAKIYAQDHAPIILRELTQRCGISQSDLAFVLGRKLGRSISKALVNLAVNKGYLPPSIPEFKAAVESFIARNECTSAWLNDNGLGVKDIWEETNNAVKGKLPEGCRDKRRSPAIKADDPEITTPWEVEMITPDALKHFHLFRNPFIDDIQKDSDVYMSDEHRYIEAAMLDASKHGGFIAVIGEVGSGKSVMRRKVVEKLKKDGDVLVIYPQMIDKTRLTASSICDAIIQDISNEKCRSKLEDKTRQVQRLLMDRAKSGYRHVLIVEEAHDLRIQTLKYLKRFYELEDGYRKLLGIILIGQSELKHTFDEGQNIDMREVIRRVQVAEIRGLNGNLKAYLSLKFHRIGKDIADIFDDSAFTALSNRLTSTAKDGKAKVSHAYPLLVNNYAARAMNTAHELGETKITADVIDAM